MDHHMYHDHDHYQHQMTNPYNTIITTQPPPTTMIMDDEKKMMTSTRPQEPRNCPRCNSSNTKFCYYNNYSLAQPRYLCKSCRRYWTEGGSLRNVPVGGGSRKNKKVPLLLPNSSSSSSTSTSKNLPDLNPPFAFTSSSNPNKTLQNNSDLSLSFSSPSKQGQGHYSHFTDGQNCLFQAPMGMIQFRQEYDHHCHNNKTNLLFSLDKKEEEITRKNDFPEGNIHLETVWNDHSRQKTVENGNHNNFTFNGEGSKMVYPYGDHDDHHNHHDQRHHHDDGNKKRESGSSNELWSGIILGGDHSGGPTW